MRGYKEHQCKFIFRLADVDLGRLGHVFGLLRMPRMAEIKHAAQALKNFRPSPVDPETVKVCANTITIRLWMSIRCRWSLSRTQLSDGLVCMMW